MKKYLEHPQALKLIDQLGEYFKDLPHLPPKVLKFLVKILPILALIGGVLSLFSSFSMLSILFGYGSLMRYSGAFFGPGYYLLTIISLVLMVSTGAILLMAFKPLKEGQQLGWLYLFYSTVLSILSSLISATFSMPSLLWALIWIAIDLYLVFELRASYKKA